MKSKKIKPLGPKLERYHIDKDDPYKAYTSNAFFSRPRENELRQKFKKKMKNRGKSIKK